MSMRPNESTRSFVTPNSPAVMDYPSGVNKVIILLPDFRYIHTFVMTDSFCILITPSS